MNGFAPENNFMLYQAVNFEPDARLARMPARERLERELGVVLDDTQSQRRVRDVLRLRRR